MWLHFSLSLRSVPPCFKKRATAQATKQPPAGELALTYKGVKRCYYRLKWVIFPIAHQRFFLQYIELAMRKA